MDYGYLVDKGKQSFSSTLHSLLQTCVCEGTCPCWHSTVELTSLVMVTSSSRGTLAILNTAALSETVMQIVVTQYLK